MLLFVPPDAPLQDRVTFPSATVWFTESEVGAPQFVGISAEDKTVWLELSITPEVIVALPSDTTRNRTVWVELPEVEPVVTDTVRTRGVVPFQLSLSFALIRTELETPLMVIVQFRASPAPMKDALFPKAAEIVKLYRIWVLLGRLLV